MADALALLKEQEMQKFFVDESGKITPLPIVVPNCPLKEYEAKTQISDAIHETAKQFRQTIVRCKDCVYWQDNNNGYPHEDCKWRQDETPDPDDFCSAGECKMTL